MSRNLRYFAVAADQALKSDMLQRHGAVLVVGNRIVGKGHNSCNPFPKMFRGCCSGEHSSGVHAEIAAIRNLVVSRRLKGQRGEKYCVQWRYLCSKE